MKKTMIAIALVAVVVLSAVSIRANALSYDDQNPTSSAAGLLGKPFGLKLHVFAGKETRFSLGGSEYVITASGISQGHAVVTINGESKEVSEGQSVVLSSLNVELFKVNDQNSKGFILVRVSSPGISVKILKPFDGQKISGETVIHAAAQSSKPFSQDGIQFYVNGKNGISIPSECSQVPAVQGLYRISCTAKFDSRMFSGAVEITAKVQDTEGISASDSVRVYPGKFNLNPEPVPIDPVQKSEVKVKAYNILTNEPVPNAVTLIMKANPSHKFWKGEVLGTVQANGIDSISLPPGMYTLITYAPGFRIYIHPTLKLSSGESIFLYAPMAKAKIAPPTPVASGQDVEGNPSEMSIVTPSI